MKQHWQRIQLKVDALSLRERAIIFAMAALILITLINTALLDPLYAKQKQLTQGIKKDQTTMAGMQVQIQQKMAVHEADPNKANKAQLQQLKQQTAQMQDALRDMQKGLVSPDKMSALLEDLLKQNRALRLVSLKTQPAFSLAEQASVEAKLIESALATIKDKGSSQSGGKLAADTVYKHDVEIVVQGGYFDIMNYLAQLEAMPWHLFWAKATLNVYEYPKTTLTLTLFTLSLDKKWLNI
ncbi:MSHA biogenesis protein MshJ [Noviherbaspirillum cavernae]|uniref:MSHA biogenesis protein MshJ n=1 Tax=Noviherbaspirillum cavernae TaxID=2320862 RepID=A0A418X1R7_9BURK|nr:type II secretion system protein GspM [Noviherbaspirillum cavernae]RJG06397.1 MSHA biogenesis protein MshJ [Noviherbaspirillum cavernae]